MHKNFTMFLFRKEKLEFFKRKIFKDLWRLGINYYMLLMEELCSFLFVTIISIKRSGL